MKKILFFLILGVSLGSAAPLYAMLIPMTEAEMRAVFGRAGVSIEIEYLIYEHDIKEMAYHDEDGTEGTEGSILIRDQHIRKVYRAIYTEDEFKKEFATATVSAANPSGLTPLATWKEGSHLTIDTGACEILTAIRNDNMDVQSDSEEKVVGVVAGLPTLMVNTTTEEFSIGVSMAGAINDNQNFIHIKTEGSAVFILGGTVEIAAR
ncbi:MAG: DUF6160 family protein [Desulfobacteraceae bacterium]|jgi:hypothetical protein